MQMSESGAWRQPIVRAFFSGKHSKTFFAGAICAKASLRVRVVFVLSVSSMVSVFSVVVFGGGDKKIRPCTVHVTRAVRLTIIQNNHRNEGTEITENAMQRICEAHGHRGGNCGGAHKPVRDARGVHGAANAHRGSHGTARSYTFRAPCTAQKTVAPRRIGARRNSEL